MEYTSLKKLRFVGFTINGMLDRDGPTGRAGTDAVGDEELRGELVPLAQERRVKVYRPLTKIDGIFK